MFPDYASYKVKLFEFNDRLYKKIFYITSRIRNNELMNNNLLIVIYILALCLACKKDSTTNDFIGTWELISMNGQFSESSSPGCYRWYNSKNISTNDNIISINTYGYNLKCNQPNNPWQGDTTETNSIYQFTVKMEIKSNNMLQINEIYRKLSNDSLYSGFINSYWLSNESTLDSYLIKLSFMEPDPAGFISLIFLKADLPVAMNEFKEKGTISISYEKSELVKVSYRNVIYTYIFRKIK